MTEATGDTRTICQFHFYGPHAGDVHRRGLWNQLDQERFRRQEGGKDRMLSPICFMIRHQAKIMHGEFGISFLAPDGAPGAWLEDVLSIHEKYRMRRNWRDYSGSEIHRRGLVGEDVRIRCTRRPSCFRLHIFGETLQREVFRRGSLLLGPSDC